MRERLYWTVLGGVCFWIPSTVSLVRRTKFARRSRGGPDQAKQQTIFKNLMQEKDPASR